MDYYKECIEEAFEDAKITATKEQMDTVISWVEGAAENEGLATGRECIPNPVQLENEALKSNLEREKEKAICPACNGHGRIVTQGPCHSSDSECFKCRGDGFIYYRPLRR
jgi:DnaJ-class molecular chaperone